MFPILILLCVALSVSGGIYAVATLFSSEKTAVENRLSALTRHISPLLDKNAQNQSVTKALNEVQNPLEKFVSRFLNVRKILDQAGMEMPAAKLLSYCGFCSGSAAIVYLLVSPLKTIAPVIAIVFFLLPIGVVAFKRRLRMKKFASQLPDALDLIG
ncbi:MAG: hypothetical protein ACKO9H_01465, partial [Planctomycetota bacterium]